MRIRAYQCINSTLCKYCKKYLNKYCDTLCTSDLNPIGGGGFKSSPLRFFVLTHLILELHCCALGTFLKK